MTIGNRIEQSPLSRSLAEPRSKADEAMDRLAGLYDAHAPGLLAYLGRRVADPAIAEELAAEAFARLLREIQRGRAPAQPGAWLYRTVTNLVVDHYRRQGRRPVIPLHAAGEGATSGDDVGMQVEQRLELERLQQALVRLSPEQQQVLTLRFGQGLSAAETAHTLAMSESAVWSHQHRGLVVLRRLLGE